MASSLVILPDPPPPPTPIGLIAGGGRLPSLIAEALVARGHPVHGLGLMNQYEDDLPPLCASFVDIALLRVGSWGRKLRRRQVRHAIMVGKIDKAQLMHDPWRIVRNIPDVPTLMGWYRHLRHDRRSHAVLAAIAEELERSGVQLMDSTSPIPDQLARSGVMTRTKPSREQEADIKFVWPLLSQLLMLDIGQGMTVRERDVLAVEAVEGTDRMIERTGQLCRAGGWTLCKGARIQHDRRSDVPTVGMDTLKKMRDHGGRCLALAADDVIMLDREEMIAEADRLGIAIVGVPVARSAMPAEVTKALREAGLNARVDSLAAPAPPAEIETSRSPGSSVIPGAVQD